MVLDSEAELSPSSILDRVNSAIYKDERISDVFITLSIICINKKSKTLTYSGAGDLPIIYKSDKSESVKSNGILLGFRESGNYENSTIQLKKNESVYLITDGIPETRMMNGEFFGEGRLKDIIDSLSVDDDPLENIINEFSSSTDNNFEDDISIIAVKSN
jgi:sigma-B regulation protein RsbU (phosphoserine phosphatase)